MIDENHPNLSAQQDLLPNTIVPFKPRVVTPEVTRAVADEAIVKLLEFWLKKAREGKIKFAALAVVEDDVAHSSYEPQEMTPVEITKALGAVGYLNHRINASALDGDNYSDEQPED